ncbi:MAG: hypothetical protein COB17_10865 [Sulfurimonas sp.]|nr:MAG: hypothetical protein COB17_10865 [Sulfurimonas sp.]
MNVTSTNANTQVYATSKTQATKATSAYEVTSQTKKTDRMSEMQEKYKDVYTPIPETYTKGSKELQQSKIYEAYPNYLTGPEFLKLVDAAYDGEPIQLGKEVTQEQKDKQKIAFDAAYAIFGGEEAYSDMMKGVKEIQNKYPVNNWGKDESVHNGRELARFTNAVIYDGLEDGKSLDDAKIYAGKLRSSFMDTSYSVRNFLDTLIKAGRADPDAQQPKYTKNEIDFNATNNSVMDLRKYGIDGNWELYKILENQQAMTSEIEKKINQFNFMLNNEDLVKGAYSKLDSSYQDLGNNAGYKQLIRDEYMPDMKEALDIFKNYKIYDSIDIKG